MHHEGWDLVGTLRGLHLAVVPSGECKSWARDRPVRRLLQHSLASLWARSGGRLAWARPKHLLALTRARVDVGWSELGCGTH